MLYRSYDKEHKKGIVFVIITWGSNYLQFYGLNLLIKG